MNKRTAKKTIKSSAGTGWKDSGYDGGITGIYSWSKEPKLSKQQQEAKDEHDAAYMLYRYHAAMESLNEAKAYFRRKGISIPKLINKKP